MSETISVITSLYLIGECEVSPVPLSLNTLGAKIYYTPKFKRKAGRATGIYPRTSRVPRFPVYPRARERLAGATGLHPTTSRVPRFPSHSRAKEMPPLGATGAYQITAQSLRYNKKFKHH